MPDLDLAAIEARAKGAAEWRIPLHDEQTFVGIPPADVFTLIAALRAAHAAAAEMTWEYGVRHQADGVIDSWSFDNEHDARQWIGKVRREGSRATLIRRRVGPVETVSEGQRQG